MVSELNARMAAALAPNVVSTSKEWVGVRWYRSTPNPIEVRPDGSIELLLPQGYRTVVDADDYPLVATQRWLAHPKGKTRSYVHVYCWYIREDTGSQGSIGIARLLLMPDPGLEVDHIDRDPLNNRRANLRIVTRSQNIQNVTRRPEASFRYRGIRQHRKRWKAAIAVQGVTKVLGSFATQEEAARSYDKAAVLYFGPGAALNFPEDRALLAAWSAALGVSGDA